MPGGRAVVWFPHNPHPPRTGAHQRCLSLLTSLRELGWTTTLLSSTLASNAWTEEGVAVLTHSLVKDVRVYHHTTLDWQLHRVWTKWDGLRGRLGRPALDSWAVVPPAERVWSRRQVESIGPDLMLSSYVQFDPLVPHFDFPVAPSMIDSIDLVGASQAMWARLAPHLQRHGRFRTADVAGEVLTEDFLRDAQQQLPPRELRLYDRYSDVLAISVGEAERIRGGTRKTRVHYVPMSAEVSGQANSYEGPPVFVGAPNPFNLQGLLWFARHVLPPLRRAAPSFQLDAVGKTFGAWQPDEGIALRGTVDDLDGVYAGAAFAICPLLAGTGEQVKIIDAMAHGLAVVATSVTASSSPIVDGVNGFVVDSSAEFAEKTEILWRDRALCHRLGDAARDTIATHYSPSRTVSELAAILGA